MIYLECAKTQRFGYIESELFENKSYYKNWL
jgi:hypothetical protein